MFRPAVVLLVVLALAPAGAMAQGGSPSPAPASARPSAVITPGTYDLEITFGGGVLAGTLTIAAVGDSLTTRMLVGDHESPVRPTRREGAQLTLESAPGMAIKYLLTFRGDTVTGTFTYDGAEGTVAGRLRRPAGS